MHAYTSLNFQQQNANENEHNKKNRNDKINLIFRVLNAEFHTKLIQFVM